MNKTIEFIFDFGSPTCYLAYTQINKIALDFDAEVEWTPVLLGGIFKDAGNQSPVMVPSKSKWMQGDLIKWSKKYNVPFELNPNFPVNTISLMRAAIGFQLNFKDLFQSYLEIMFKAMWVKQVNLNDTNQVNSILKKSGFDLVVFNEMINDPIIKKKLIENSNKAVERGAFGAPTFFLNNEMFFGQDRLEFIKDSLRSI